MSLEYDAPERCPMQDAFEALVPVTRPQLVHTRPTIVVYAVPGEGLYVMTGAGWRFR
jgi:hypothetical protein